MAAGRLGRIVGVGLAALALLAGPGLAGGSTLPERVVDTWVPNGSISSAAFFAGRLIVGGSFTGLAPRTGPAVLLDRTTGRRLAFPRVEDGRVSTAIGDGAGGWYLGGTFTRVDGIARSLLVHVRADGSVDRGFDAHVEGSEVDRLALGAQGLYVSGAFDRVDGVERSFLARVDPVTGALATWDPGEIRFDANRSPLPPTGLVVAGGAVWVSGWFRQIGGRSAANLAALDEATAEPRGFDPGVDREIRSLVTDGTTVFAAGPFSRAGGAASHGIAAWDATTGSPRTFAPFIEAPYDTRYLLAAHDGAVLAAAWRTRSCRRFCGTLTELALIRLDGSTAWRSRVIGRGEVAAAVLDDERILIGGFFARVDGEPRRGLAALALATGELLDWAPAAGPAGRQQEAVATLAAGPTGVLVGGRFTGWGGVERDNLAALDDRTGRPLPWSPRVAASPSLDVAGSRLYVLGRFGWIGDRRRNGAASFDGALRPTAWRPPAAPLGYSTATAVARDRVALTAPCEEDGGSRGPLLLLDAGTGRPISDRGPRRPTGCRGALVARTGGLLWVASSRGGRLVLRGFDETTGRIVVRRQIAVDGPVGAFAPFGDRLFVAGDFTRIAGRARARIAAIDLLTGRADGWRASWSSPPAPVGYYPVSLGVTDGALLVAGIAEGGRLAAFDLATGEAIDWRTPTDAQAPTIRAASGDAVVLTDPASPRGLILLRR